MSIPTDAAQPSCQNVKSTFVEGIYAPDSSMPTHAHPQAGLYLALRGRHTVTCRKTTHLAEPGTLIFHPAAEPHQCCFPTEAKTFEIYLEPSWFESLRPDLTMLDRPSCHSTGDLPRLAVRAYNEFCIQDAFSSLALEGLVLEILAGIARHNANEADTLSQRPPRWLREAHDLLQERFAEPLALDEIAQAVSVHPAHLGRMFRRYYHRTLGEIQRDLRLQHARRLLSTSDAPLVEIALSCGYSDQSHFTTAFRRHTGSTPAEYRKLFHTRSFREKTQVAYKTPRSAP